MATVKQAITLKRQPNLGEETEEVAFEQGDEVTLLKRWDDSYLCKSSAGYLFHFPKDTIDP